MHTCIAYINLGGTTESPFHGRMPAVSHGKFNRNLSASDLVKRTWPFTGRRCALCAHPVSSTRFARSWLCAPFARASHGVPSRDLRRKNAIRNLPTRAFQPECANQSVPANMCQPEGASQCVPARVFQPECASQSAQVGVCQSKRAKQSVPAREYQQ